MTRPFGVLLRSLRTSRRMNLGTLAGCVGIAATYLSDVENGRRRPFGMTTVDRCASVLELTDKETSEFRVSAAMTRGAIDIPTRATAEHVASAISLLNNRDFRPSRLDELLAALGKRPDAVDGNAELSKSMVDSMLEDES